MTEEVLQREIETQLEVAMQGIPLKVMKEGQIWDFIQDTVMQIIANIDVQQVPAELRERLYDIVKGAFDKFVRPMPLPKFLDDMIWNRLSIRLMEILSLS